MAGHGLTPECDATDDHELVQRTKLGDRSAFELLVRRYQDRAYSVAFQILGHHEDALDVAQEAFARAYLSIARFRGHARFYTWLYRILVNLAIDEARARGKETPVPPDTLQAATAERNPAADPCASLEIKELGEEIARACCVSAGASADCPDAQGDPGAIVLGDRGRHELFYRDSDVEAPCC